MVFRQEAWDNYFLLSITRRGASAQNEVQFAAIVDPKSLEIEEGEQASESMPNAAGGRIWRDDPQADGTVTFDIIPIELDSTSGVGLFQQYIGVSGTSDPNDYVTSEPLETDTSWPAGVVRVRDKFRVVVLRTNDAAATTAGGTTAASTDSLRFIANNCKFVNMTHSDSDGQLKSTVTFKFKPYNKAGTTKNYAWQSGDQTAMVTTGPLASYTTGSFPD